MTIKYDWAGHYRDPTSNKVWRIQVFEVSKSQYRVTQAWGKYGTKSPSQKVTEFNSFGSADQYAEDMRFEKEKKGYKPCDLSLVPILSPIVFGNAASPAAPAPKATKSKPVVQKRQFNWDD